MTGFAAEILARDGDGTEHHMAVSHRLLDAGLVVLEDDAATRILSVSAALGLCSELIRATIRHRQNTAGPLSSTF